jgi:hypothetical protein
MMNINENNEIKNENAVARKILRIIRPTDLAQGS